MDSQCLSRDRDASLALIVVVVFVVNIPFRARANGIAVLEWPVSSAISERAISRRHRDCVLQAFELTSESSSAFGV